jgi:hypothetical protein
MYNGLPEETIKIVVRSADKEERRSSRVSIAKRRLMACRASHMVKQLLSIIDRRCSADAINESRGYPSRPVDRLAPAADETMIDVRLIRSDVTLEDLGRIPWMLDLASPRLVQSPTTNMAADGGPWISSSSAMMIASDIRIDEPTSRIAEITFRAERILIYESSSSPIDHSKSAGWIKSEACSSMESLAASRASRNPFGLSKGQPQV